MIMKYCINVSCNKAPLKTQKGITLWQEGIKIEVPDVEIQICPICGEESHSYEAMGKIYSTIEKTLKEKKGQLNKKNP